MKPGAGRLAVLAVCGLLMSAQSTGQTISLDEVSLYAGGALTFGNNVSVNGGATVAGANVTGTLDVDSIYGTGSLTSNGFDQTRGEVFFNGSINGVGGPGSVIDGPVTSAAGDITIAGSTTVNGNVTASGNINQTFTFGTFNGNVLAGGDVDLQGTVNGDVTHGGSLTLGTFADVTGTTTPGGPVSPTPFVAPNLGPGRLLSAGSNDIDLVNFEDIALTPGTYGSLNYAQGNTVSLTAGAYVFADIVSGFNLNELSFDTSGGDIEFYIEAADVNLDLVQVVNGVALFAGVEPDPATALNITLEVADSLELASDFYGTVLAPEGNLTLDTFTQLTGRALAGGDVLLRNSSAIRAVPEPSSLLLTLGGLGLLARRRARR